MEIAEKVEFTPLGNYLQVRKRLEPRTMPSFCARAHWPACMELSKRNGQVVICQL
jgi:hypothetical protein